LCAITRYLARGHLACGGDLARDAGRHGHLEAPAVLALFELTKPTPWRQRGGGASRLIPRYEMDAMLAERRVREAITRPMLGKRGSGAAERG